MLQLSIKIPIKNLYYLLSYAFSNPYPEKATTLHITRCKNTEELLAYLLVECIEHFLAVGLHQTYQQQTTTQTTVRGHLELVPTWCNLQRHKLQVVCTYQALTCNNLYNQILKTALYRLLSPAYCTTLVPDIVLHLQRVYRAFATIDLLTKPCCSYRHLDYDYNNRHYRWALCLAELILGDIIPQQDPTSHLLQEVLADTTGGKLFENFVRNYLRKHYPMLTKGKKAINWAFTPADVTNATTHVQQLPLQVCDILLEQDTKTLIIDTKFYADNLQQHYQSQGNAKIISEHLNQILVYAQNYQLAHPQQQVEGMLLYAKTIDKEQPKLQCTLWNNITTKAQFLDLDLPYQQIAQQLDTLVTNSFPNVSKVY